MTHRGSGRGPTTVADASHLDAADAAAAVALRRDRLVARQQRPYAYSAQRQAEIDMLGEVWRLYRAYDDRPHMDRFPPSNDSRNTMTINPTSALLFTLAGRSEQALQPAARGLATANTLREFAAIPNLPAIDAADLISAFIVLSCSTASDTPPVISRRATCRELADIMPGGLTGIARPSAAALALWAAFDRIAGEGPRIDAIKGTAMREFRELVAAATDDTRLAFLLTHRV